MTTTQYVEKGESITAILKGRLSTGSNWVSGDLEGLAPVEFWGRLVDVLEPPKKTDEPSAGKPQPVPQRAQLYSNESEACCALDILDLIPVRTPSSGKLSSPPQTNATDELCCHDRILNLIVGLLVPLTSWVCSPS